MKFKFVIMLLAVSITGYCQNKQTKTVPMKNKIEKLSCSESCSSKALSCKLTSPELQKRKETVIANLKKQVIRKSELKNGYSYAFKGTDEIIGELTEFIKTERQCCDFFDFEIKVSGDSPAAILSITGPKGAKEFIDTELDL